MSVSIRKRKNSDGTTSLILDIYHNGQRKREYLHDLKLLSANTPHERTENKERMKLAEQIRNKRAQMLVSDDYQVAPDFKRSIPFIVYFENYLAEYNKKDKRVMVACLAKFKEFMKDNKIDTLTIKQVSVTLVCQFKDYLESNLNGETPANYFKKFKRILANAVKEKMISSNPTDGITFVRKNGIEKDILNFDEIQLLASAEIGNKEVKRAFLFSCLTGLRFCDINSLKWKHVNGSQLKMTQQKTDVIVNLVLNGNAISLLGNSGKSEDFIFELPTHNACLKNLKTWCNNAGVKKHITFHCARHSFGVNLITYGSDVNTVSKLLGHKSLAYTQRYLREAESLKERAVDNLPKIQLAND